MVFNFYVYYRVAAGQEARARERVSRVQRALGQSTSAGARLLTKRNDARLWMEVYEGVIDAAAFESLLEHAASELSREGLLESGWSRRVECFEDAPCA
jgi:hypothetical protein